MKVILFILSLHCNVKRPFLIISTSTALSVWETEFLHLAPSANLVVYKGNKDVRSSIRALEFYNDHGGILFQILLASSDVIIEDLHVLRCIPWEVIVIDECQRSKILGHFDNMKILATQMRLLLVSGQIKEDRADYIKLLSFLKSGHHQLNIAQMETYFSASISNLKSQLEQQVAFKCNSGSTRFVEYWVPAPLSSLQLEQYCSMLLSNSILLCSGQKSDSVDAFRDLIISTRKCCDHPYLLDQSLHNFVTRGLPVEEYLNIGIKASGKLHLLEKVLLEVRSRGLRVIILFQSTTGGSASIGDILDDVLCQRFGKDCYVRYGRGYTPSKKQAAIDTFNDRESGKFVFLIENRACLPSVKLSSVDTVILFDSGWDPQNDLRALQRMSISSQFKQLTVFRLYSSFTVEEKVLMLAKEGIALDSNMQLINQSTCHTLLKWGASYLFDKLDDLHGSGNSVSAADISSDESLLSDVICELSSQLVCSGADTDFHGWSFILGVQHNGGDYAKNILLLGERVMKKLDNGPHAFSWSDLLKGRHPRWKLLSVSSQRIRKTVKHFDHIQKESEYEIDDIIRKRRKMSKDNVDPERGKVSKDNVDVNRRKVSKDSVDPKKREVSKDSVDPNRGKVSKDGVDPKRRKVSKDCVDPNRGKVSKDGVDPKKRKVSKDGVDPNRGKVSKDGVDPKKRKVSKDNVDPNWGKVSKDSVDPKKRKVSKDNVDPKGQKVSKGIVDPRTRKVSKDVIDAKRREVSKNIIDSKIRKVSKDIVDSKSRKVSKDIVDSKHLKTRLKNKSNLSAVNKASKMNGNKDGLSKVLDSIVHPLTGEITRAAAVNVQFSEQKKLLDLPKSTESLPKSDIPGLCNVLHLPKNVKAIAVRILEHIFKHYDVNCQEVSTMQAFEISVCWLAASLFKHKIDRKDSLALAKLYMNFNCKEDEATEVYSELRKFKNDFSSCLQNGVCVEKCNLNGASDSKTPELKELAEEKQKGSLGPHVSNLVESATNEHDLRRKSPTTVLSSQDQTYTENFHSSPSTAHEIWLSQNTSNSLPVEADAISVEFDADDRTNAVTSITPEVSFLEHQNKVPDSSNDPYNVNPVTGSLERYSPVRSTEIAESDDKVSEDRHILVNEVVVGDDSVNMFTQPPQLNSVQTDAVTCDSTAVPEVRQSYSVVSPVCGETTTLEFAETTLPFMQQSHANLWPLPRMTTSAIPSFLEDSSASTVMPLDKKFYNSSGDHCNVQEAEVLLQAANDPLEPANSYFVSPVTQQPSTSAPMNENTTHVPHSFTNPGNMNSDPFQAQSLTSEMPHIAYPNPLLNEMERIKKGKEEAFKIHETKILQLQSDKRKEIEKLVEKYSMLLQDVNTAVALKRKELETQCQIVLMNDLLAEAWIHRLDSCKRAAAQCAEQGFHSAVPMPSSSGSHVSKDHTSHVPAQRLEQCTAGPSIIHPSLYTPMVVVHPSTTIPEISPIGVCFNPMNQFCRSLHDGCDLLATAPPLGASAAASSYSIPLMPNGCSGISDQLQYQS